MLSSALFPSQWAHNYSEASWENNRFSKLSNNTWSILKLQELFYQYQDQVPTMLCAFIDGLDEYDYNKRKIADVVIELSKLSKIKLYVSSRLLLEFGDAFEEYPGLELQDPTRKDTQSYVADH
jgi:hypothetical protein